MTSDSDSSDTMQTSQGTPGKSGRKNIRKVLKDKQVADDTKQAAKEEEERLKRIAERQALVYNSLVLPTVTCRSRTYTVRTIIFITV